MNTKAYRVTLTIVDHDRVGAKGITEVIEHQRYPNRCIHPAVVRTEVADLGAWDDDHPVNRGDWSGVEFGPVSASALVRTPTLREQVDALTAERFQKKNT
jgi:hypothetical protein